MSIAFIGGKYLVLKYSFLFLPIVLYLIKFNISVFSLKKGLKISLFIFLFINNKIFLYQMDPQQLSEITWKEIVLDYVLKEGRPSNIPYIALKFYV